MHKNLNCNALRSKLLLARVSVSPFRSASLRFKETTGFYPSSFSDQLATTYFRSYLYYDTPSSISFFFFILNNNRVIFKHCAKTLLPTSIFTERFSLLKTNRAIFRLKFWDKLAFKGKFSANLAHWITSS